MPKLLMVPLAARTPYADMCGDGGRVQVLQLYSVCQRCFAWHARGMASMALALRADELPVHYRGGVGKSEKRRVGGGGEVYWGTRDSDLGPNRNCTLVLINGVLFFTGTSELFYPTSDGEGAIRRFWSTPFP